MFRQLGFDEINKIFEIFSSINPSPKIELNYTNEFTLLIAVLLSAQSTDKMVNNCTAEFFAQYDTPEKVLQLGIFGVEYYIKKIGLYRNKAKNIITMSHQLIEKHNGTVPKNFKDLLNLAGVGRKTADVVLNSAFGQPTIAVDRHIHRIVRRIGLDDGKTVNNVADNLLQKIDSKWHKYAHHWLVLHGRHTCKAAKPQCNKCPIINICIINIG